MSAKPVILSASIALFVFSALSYSAPVAAQSRAVNSARIEVVERKIRAIQSRLGLQATAADGEAVAAQPPMANRRLVADLSAKLGGVERQLRLLNGRLEEYEFKQRQLEKSLDLLRKELTLQREDMLAVAPNGSAGNGQPGSVAGLLDRATPRATEAVIVENLVVELPQGEPKVQYDYAFDFIRKNDLASGQIAMEQFIAANAGDTRVGNAKFWLGRVYARQSLYGKAAEQWFALIESHPNHNKRAEALVELAGVMVEQLGDSQIACDALSEFRRIRDGVTARLKTRAEKIGETAKCG